MITTCLGCGMEFERRRRGVFCNNACQQSYQRRMRLEIWLKTGVCGRMSYQGHFVRDYIHEQQAGCCAICATKSSWNGSVLTLILDHIDGDATNNRRENLRLICPNCDSQLPTYKARNRGNGRHCRRQRYADGLSY
ncbi:HNH endonuclease [Mycobacterium sp. SMC-4]|uniref:HNH endonuclease n=1 Tax=Mycobacterium sp. SMC-4 TaxID=2857059 RepID=UPI003D02BFAE